MTVVMCIVALTGAPCSSHGGHATFASATLPARGGQAIVVTLEPIGNLENWVCIHEHEGAWDDTGDPYWGGLQMDVSFMTTYGSDMIRKYGGYADQWSARDQMVVAQRAYASGRGYYPWPNTARMCGLI